jgi:hypothetical protein
MRLNERVRFKIETGRYGKARYCRSFVGITPSEQEGFAASSSKAEVGVFH